MRERLKLKWVKSRVVNALVAALWSALFIYWVLVVLAQGFPGAGALR